MKTITLSVLDGGFLIQAREPLGNYIWDGIRVTLPEAMECLGQQLAAMEDAEAKMLGMAQLAPDHSET